MSKNDDTGVKGDAAEEQVDDENQDDSSKAENQDDATGETDDDSTDDENSESEADDENAEEESGEGDSADDDTSEFTKRFTQFKGDTPEEYLPNLEDGYANSIKEGQRLKTENDQVKDRADRAENEVRYLRQVIAKHPEVAKELEEDVPAAPLSPEMQHARTQMEQQMEKEFNEFADAHPAITDDDSVADAVRKETNRYANYVWQTEQRQVSMKEALEFAWNKLGFGNSDDGSSVNEAVRNKATQSKPVSKRKPVEKKSEYTKDQLDWARKVDPSLSGKSDKEVAEALAKSSKPKS